MSAYEDMLKVLNGSGAMARDIDPDNKESLIALGTVLEKAFQMAGGSTYAAAEPCQAALEIIQKIFNDDCEDPRGAMQAVGAALTALEMALASDKGLSGGDPLRDVMSDLRSAVQERAEGSGGDSAPEAACAEVS
ncbi:MAG: hypothetical protein J7M14_07475, partial [Planctomycetes bacterium]|nr:hypothetical protein [Planctomycetota bacterium]